MIFARTTDQFESLRDTFKRNVSVWVPAGTTVSTGKDEGKKRLATDPNETISFVAGSVYVYVRRRAHFDSTAVGWDEIAERLRHTSARGRTTAGSGRLDRHERIALVIKFVDFAGIVHSVNGVVVLVSQANIDHD